MKTSLIPVLCCWLIASNSFAQPSSSSGQAGTTDKLSVQLWPQLSREVFHAPATVRIAAYVTVRAPAHAGDFIGVEFFANTNNLGSSKSFWHGAIRPQTRSGQPTPMYVIAPGFSPANFIWTNVPAGQYTLTARATCTNGLSAVSEPLQLTVSP